MATELNWEAILGIVVGLMVFLLFLSLLISCCIRERDIAAKQKQLDMQTKEQASAMHAPPAIIRPVLAKPRPAPTPTPAPPTTTYDTSRYVVTVNQGRVANHNLYSDKNELQSARVNFVNPQGGASTKPQYSRVVAEPARNNFRHPASPGQVNVYGPATYDYANMRPLNSYPARY